MHNCIIGFYFRYQANTGAFLHKYRRVDLVDGRPPLSERMEFSDNQDPFRGAIINLPLLIVRGVGSPKGLLRNIHKMTATQSYTKFHIYNNFLPCDFDDYEWGHIKYKNRLWMAHATRWEEDVGMNIVLTNFNREWWNCINNEEIRVRAQEKTRIRWMPYHSDAWILLSSELYFFLGHAFVYVHELMLQ